MDEFALIAELLAPLSHDAPGAFDLTDEPSDAGPRLLRQTVKARGLAASRFHVLRPGGAMGFDEDEVSTRACFSFDGDA